MEKKQTLAEISVKINGNKKKVDIKF